MADKLFVTGGSGYVGSAFVRRALEAGYEVEVLTRSEQTADRLRASGAVPVLGDLSEKGLWQQTAASAQVVVHLAQPETYGERITLKRALNYREKRLLMDKNLLTSLHPDTVKRIVYVGGTSYYGDQGLEQKNEDTKPNPKGWGPYIAPAIEALPGYVTQGLPIVEAFPAWIYGTGSWFAEYVLEPLVSGKPLTGLRGRQRIASPIHQEDCARALLHLITRGEVGRRYFLVDDKPVQSGALAMEASKALNVPLKTRIVPVFMARLFLGPVVTESLTCDANYSNARLKQTGFTFDYSTYEQGVPDVVKRWQTNHSGK